MQTKLENKAAAWVITVLVMLFAVLLGGRASLLFLREEAWALFAGGENGEAGIDYDLREIAASAENLITVASKYDHGSEELFKNMRIQMDDMQNHVILSQREWSAGYLRENVEELNLVMNGLPLVEEDRAYQAELNAEIESRYRIIGNSAYNEMAEAFNRALDRQPAGFIAALTGVEGLPPY